MQSTSDKIYWPAEHRTFSPVTVPSVSCALTGSTSNLLTNGQERRRMEVEVLVHLFLTSPLQEGKWSASSLGRFNPRGKRPTDTKLIEGRVGPMTSLVASKRRKDTERFVDCPARGVVTILTEQSPRNATGRTCSSPGTCLLSLSQTRHAVARTLSKEWR